MMNDSCQNIGTGLYNITGCLMIVKQEFHVMQHLSLLSWIILAQVMIRNTTLQLLQLFYCAASEFELIQ